MKLLKILIKFNVFIITILTIPFTVYAEIEPELLRSSVVVVKHPEFKSARLKSFSWAADHADVSAGLQKPDFSISALIDEAIQHAIKQKSYPFLDDIKGSLLIQYHVSLASELNDTALTLKYGLSPGLRANSLSAKEHERGTLVVDIIEPELNKVVWRGAVEVFTGVKNTQQGRQKRLNKLLLEMFNGIPSLKSAE
ncbi:MAG: DUF4136 domain-containing protein [Gammaproteobacteria bacterium]|nr:DUF4136 domain-containing protein [Gammaproteobacteria bacterium]